VATVLSFGQDPRWRRALVDEIRASPHDRVLDVATGTGMVADALVRRYGCHVVGLDQSQDMLALARQRNGTYDDLVVGRAEHMPFPDASFDHLTFTYLLRYVDDPASTMRELARVVKPGGRVAMVEFGVPTGIWWPFWWLYTRIGLPVLGQLVSGKWRVVGGFLGPSISRFHARHPLASLERDWRNAGLADIRIRRMSLGGGLVMSATRSDQQPPAVPAAALAPAFYAARSGGWRDYWTLLHPPYTVWHLSYVLLGASLAPSPDPRVVGGALLAFFLAVGLGAHAFDELRGRPLRTRIPSSVLVAIGTGGLGGAAVLGLLAAAQVGSGMLAFVAAGVALVLAYAFEVPVVHSDVGFALGWGAFPVATAAFAVGAPPLPTLLAAAAAALLSAAQRALSTRARSVRRRATEVSGTVRYADGTSETIDRQSLIAAPESALRILWLAVLAVALASLLSRWV
jgi:demethylmenaquinone methyltransferase / 2-methoxy-6-polyprenyl-1,4-benzoquinol methylase